MKRFILIIMLSLIPVTAMAYFPRLAVESAFTRKDIKKPGIKIVFTNQPDNYFRSITATKDPALRDIIRKLVEADRKRAYNVSEQYEGDGGGIILNILHEGKYVHVGFSFGGNGDFRLFLQTDNPELFKR